MKSKFIISVIVFSLFSTFVFAKGSFSWVILINMNDCIHCLGGLNRIGRLDNRYPKTIVFQEIDLPDSTALIKKLFLKDFQGSIVFNDSLYNKFDQHSTTKKSSVFLYNKHNDKCIYTPLVTLPFYVKNLNGFLDPRDTIKLKQPVFQRAIFTSNLKNIYIVDLNTSVLRVFNRVSRKKRYEIKLTKDLLTKGYVAKFGKEKGYLIYEKTMDFVSRNKIIGGQAKIHSFSLNGDTLYLSVMEPLLSKTGETIKQKYKNIFDTVPDTAIGFIKTLYAFIYNKLVNVSNVSNYLNGKYLDSAGIRRHFIKDTSSPYYKNDVYFLGIGFFIFNDYLYQELYSDYIVKEQDNQVLARFKKTKKGNWIFDRFVAALPRAYIKQHIGYNGDVFPIRIRHSESYFNLFHGDTLYSVDRSKPPIPLNFLNLDHANYRNVQILDFKRNKKYLYLITDIITENDYVSYYYKYNIQAQEVVLKKRLTKKELPQPILFPQIDPFDYSCVLVPISQNELLRVRVNH